MSRAVRLPFLIGAAQAAGNGLLKNLLAYYAFTSNANDSLGNFDGTTNASIINDSTRGNCYFFGNAYMTSSVAGAKTISIWFKTTSTASTYKVICNLMGGVNSNKGFNIEMISNGKLDIVIEAVIRSSVSASAYNDGSWHCAILEISGNTLSLYVNDPETPIVTYTNSAVASNYNTGLIVGRSGNATSANYFYYPGYVSDTALWSDLLTVEQKTLVMGGLTFPQFTA